MEKIIKKNPKTPRNCVSGKQSGLKKKKNREEKSTKCIQNAQGPFFSSHR